MATEAGEHLRHQANGGPINGGRLPLTLRIGNERAAPTHGCWENDCEVPAIRPTDVYCHTHERFLPLAISERGNARRIMITLVILALCGAFLLAGNLESPLPSFGVALAVGALALVLPIRHYPATWRAALLVWIIIAITFFILNGTADATHRWARLIFLAALLALATWHFNRRFGATTQRPAAAIALVPAAIGTACLAAYLASAINPWQLLPTAVDEVGTSLLFAAAGGWLLASLLFIVVGALDGASTPVTPVPPLLSRPRPPIRQTPSGGLLDQIGTTSDNVARFILFVLAQVGVLVTNLMWFILVVCARRIWITVQRAWHLFAAAARTAAWVALATARVVIIPVCALAIAGWLAVVFAVNITDYLATDALQSLLRLLGAAVLGGTCILATWALLAYRSTPVANANALLQSVSHNLKITTPHWLLVQLAGGWLVGLPAMFGHGQVRVGWFTYGSTAAVLLALGFHRARRRDT